MTISQEKKSQKRLLRVLVYCEQDETGADVWVASCLEFNFNISAPSESEVRQDVCEGLRLLIIDAVSNDYYDQLWQTPAPEDIHRRFGARVGARVSHSLDQEYEKLRSDHFQPIDVVELGVGQGHTEFNAVLRKAKLDSFDVLLALGQPIEECDE